MKEADRYLQWEEMREVKGALHPDTSGFYKESFELWGEGVDFRERRVKTEFWPWGKELSVGIIRMERDWKERGRWIKLEVDDTVKVVYGKKGVLAYEISLDGWMDYLFKFEGLGGQWGDKYRGLYEDFRRQEGRMYWRADMVQQKLRVGGSFFNKEEYWGWGWGDDFSMPFLGEDKEVGVSGRVRDREGEVYQCGVDGIFQQDTDYCYWSLKGFWRQEDTSDRRVQVLTKMGVPRRIKLQRVEEMIRPGELKKLGQEIFKRYK